MTSRRDLAIVGSGFSGSLLAMIARRLGLSVVLIEKGRHPRVVIGESSTPLTNLLLEELSDRYDLPSVRPLSKWGSWQREHPEIACGLKRGFTFYHHDLANPAFDPGDRSRQLLVAASPHDEVSDTHWYRADFDQFLMREAEKLGVDYFDETALTGFAESDREATLHGARQGRDVTISAKFVVDASGPRGFLHRALGLGELELASFPATQALYSHFQGVRRLEELYGVAGSQPPYPVDDAAVHHVFDGGWIWVLRFNNGITSAGIAATDALAEKYRFAEGAEAWRRLLCDIPAFESQFVSAKAVLPFTHIPRMAFRSAQVAGRRWALLPSAAGFVDPLLSTGFPLTLLGVSRLAEIFERDWGSTRLEARLADYSVQTDADLLATSHLISGLYANMDNFSVFVSLSLLYFAAVSFSEAARRLGKPHLAPSFLLRDHRVFALACMRLIERARQPLSEERSRALSEEILKTIEPINVAGLGDPRRRNWYPVDPDDLVRSAFKLSATESEVMEVLKRCGFGNISVSCLGVLGRFR